MDKFKTRFKYYLIGLGFGVIIVYFLFGNRGCSWLPENRVKNMIGEKAILAGDSILAVMNCLEIDNNQIYDLLKDEGDVIFSKSITNENPKVYLIEGETEGTNYSAKFALNNLKETAELVAVSKEGASACNVAVSNAQKFILPLPHADVVAIIESNEFRILDKAECDLAFYQLDESALFQFHTNATVNIALSEPRKSPNPIYVMDGAINAVPYTVVYEIGDNRTRIKSISGAQPSNCE